MGHVVGHEIIGGSPIFIVVSVLKVMRITRILIIMRFVAELRLLVSCLVHSVKSFFWAFALVCMITYILAIFFTQITLYYVVDKDADEEGAASLRKLYGSVMNACISLMGGLTGGIDWVELVRPLVTYVSPTVGLLFVLVITFNVLALMNVVTATFVYQAMERASDVEEMQKISQACMIFDKLNSEGTGSISFAALSQHLDSDEVQAFFESMEIDTSHAELLFNLMDSSNDCKLDFSEFISGCLRLQEPARTIDIVFLLKELKESHR